MAQVRVVLPDGVHDAVRVEAARRKVSIAVCVAELVGEVLGVGGGLGVVHRVGGVVVGSQSLGEPVRPLSKSDQAKGRRGKS